MQNNKKGVIISCMSGNYSSRYIAGQKNLLLWGNGRLQTKGEHRNS
ncbi:hypothetical protein DORLON_01141 [Dorea longicatena DSM 13814]|uniref:Uncharacterized protein n=1 Tax=Dorea longicatena DSM 13814 TaxID=411462 RepID=A6BFR9_9FIRM|nr:hypothetical protein DORLON_01141 [Dorea longicatena DSM 13814]